MKGGNPKPRIWDVVVTYWDFDEFIEIYIHKTIRLSKYNKFQFECVNINLPLNLPMSETTSQNLGFGFPPFICYMWDPSEGLLYCRLWLAAPSRLS